jgi:F-type H+-transporting ATPase subunit alpha
VQNNFLDDVAVEKIKDFQAKLMDFFLTRKTELLAKIRNEKAISDAIAAELKQAVPEFKQSYR